MQSLTVLNVAYPFAPVRPDTPGGAEQVLANIDRALVHAGHRSIVIAQQGSETAGKLIAVPAAQELITDSAREIAWEIHRLAIDRAVYQFRPDVVHMHGIDFDRYLPEANIPVIATLHLPPSWYPPGIFHPQRPNTYLHCVSRSQEGACPASAALLPVIENGVPDTLFAPFVKPKSFCLMLGRICQEKGIHLAIEAAKGAEASLLIAGQTFPYPDHVAYFEQQVAPALDRKRRFIGPAGIRRKRRLLSSARCLLVPSLAPETSSLVAMEALMCGTPVIAFRAGALPGLIDEGVTGFIVEGPHEMAQAIGRAHQLDRGACRARACERFSLQRSMAAYLRMYRNLVFEQEAAA